MVDSRRNVRRLGNETQAPVTLIFRPFLGGWARPVTERGRGMAKREPRSETSRLEHEVEEFERSNPEVGEAMRLFGMSIRSYMLALQATKAMMTSTSDSTTSIANAYLDGDSAGD